MFVAYALEAVCLGDLEGMCEGLETWFGKLWFVWEVGNSLQHT